MPGPNPKGQDISVDVSVGKSFEVLRGGMQPLIRLGIQIKELLFIHRPRSLRLYAPIPSTHIVKPRIPSHFQSLPKCFIPRFRGRVLLLPWNAQYKRHAKVSD